MRSEGEIRHKAVEGGAQGCGLDFFPAKVEGGLGGVIAAAGAGEGGDSGGYFAGGVVALAYNHVLHVERRSRQGFAALAHPGFEGVGVEGGHGVALAHTASVADEHFADRAGIVEAKLGALARVEFAVAEDYVVDFIGADGDCVDFGNGYRLGDDGRLAFGSRRVGFIRGAADKACRHKRGGKAMTGGILQKRSYVHNES